MGRHFAKALREEAQPPYTDDFLAKVLEREPSTFYRLRHDDRHLSLQLVFEIVGALTPGPDQLKVAPYRTYNAIARKLVAAYYADEHEIRLEKMAKSVEKV